MAEDERYLIEVKELIDHYGLEEVARLLKLTPRGVQYWTSETEPKKPGPQTRRTIHELHQKHKKGEKLISSNDPDYKDRYIKILEEQVNYLQGQLRHLLILTHAKVATNQQALADLLVKQKIEEGDLVEDRLSKENLQNYQKLKLELNIP